MLYQEYKLKIEKRMAFRKRLRRYRVPIIAACAIVLALALAFVITKGMVTGSQLSNDKIEYGNEPDFSAGALFADAWYEYRKSNDTEWSTKIPVEMGEYYVRGVSRGIFGIRYGEEKLFSIVPRVIEVYADGERVKYGENPTPTADLAFDDRVYCDQFVFADTTREKTDVTPVLEAIVIKDKNGTDVTGCYQIKVKAREIAFNKRDITLIIDSKETEYNGNIHTHEVWQVAQGGGLVYDDVLVKVDGTFTGITNVGSAVNRGEFRVIRATQDGVCDVTHQYSINQIAGKLTVTQRPVVILPSGGEYTYDGQEHSVLDFTVSDKTPLVEGHTASVESAPSIKNVGTVDNLPIILITGADGKNETANYCITYEGDYVLKVNPLDTSVTTESGEIVYNGRDNTFENCIVTDGFALAEGHSLAVKEATAFKNEGVYTNEVTVQILDENGADVTGNYNVAYVNGQVTVLKREIKITSGTLYSEYNGAAQGESSLIFVDGQLIDGHRVDATFHNTVTDCKIVLDNTFDAVILDENGEDVTSNYEMERVFGTLEVFPLTIRIKTDSAEKVYDGTPLKKESFTYIDGSAKIVEGHTVEYIGAPSITDVQQGFMLDVKNEFTIKIYEGEVDKTFNYNIIYEKYGYLTIMQRQLLVSADGYTKTYYDGLPIEDLTYTVGGDGVAPNQRIDVSTYVEERTKAGSWKYRITGVRIYDANDVDVTPNYYIEKENATIFIGKRPVLVTSNGFANTVYYDGEQHREETYTLFSPAGEPLAVGESIRVRFNKGSYVEYATQDTENAFTVERIYNEETLERTTSNYEISTIFGVLHLEKRPVYLISDSMPDRGAMYDGYMHKQESFTDDKERGMGIVAGQRVEAVYEGYIVNVGETDNTFLVKAIYDKKGVDVIESYEISYESGKLRVYPRPITLTSQSATKVYDDNRLTCEDVLIGGYGVADGEYVEFSNFAYLVGAGKTANTFDYVIKYTDGRDVPRENYDVTVNYTGELEVTKRPVYITIRSHEKVYDGLVLRPAGYSTPRYDDVYERDEGILPYHTLSMKLTGERLLVGTQVIGYEDVKIAHVYNAGLGSDMSLNCTFNYELIIIDGTLTVTQRDVVLDAPDQTKEYDGTYLMGKLGPQDVVGGLGANDVIYVTMMGEQVNVGTSVTQVVEYWIIHAGTTNVTHCYNVKEILDGSVTITPRLITVNVLGSTKEYYDGGAVLPQGYETERLLDGHRTELELTGAQIDVGMSYASVLNGSFKVFDSNGEDITYNYEYKVNEGELTVAKKRPITITSSSATFDYDTTAHKSESYEIGGMGHATERVEDLVVTFTGGEMIEAGIYENSFDATVIVFADGEDVSHNYEIERIFGQIEIKRVKITVITGSATKEFDLEPLTSSDARYESANLPTGYRVEVSAIGTITNASSVANGYTIAVYDREGNAVDMSNYEIIEELGTLTVEPIRLTITSGTAEKIYDGTYLSENSYTSNWEETAAYKGGRLNLVVTVTGKRRDIGRSNNMFMVGLYDKNGVNHAEGNCEITTEYGTLTVYAPPIVLTSSTVSAVYNGREVRGLYVTVTDGAIGKGHRLTEHMSIAPVDVGVYENLFTFDIVDSDGASVMEFYRDVTCEYGVVTVLPYKITVKPISVTQQYRGETLCAPSEIDLPNEDIDALNDNPLFVYTYSIDDLSDICISAPGEMLYYTIPTDRVHIYMNGEELDGDNFEIISEQAYLKLAEKLVEINVYKIVKTYNGKLVAYNEDDWYLREGQLPEGYTLDFKLEGGLTDVGSLDFDELLDTLILNDKIHVYDENGNDVTSRFDFLLVGTPLTVTPKALELTAGSAEKYYDGEPLTSNEYQITGGALARGHSIKECAIIGTVTDVETVTNRIVKVVIVDQNGKDVTDNYNLTFIDGQLEVLEKPQ